VDETLCATGAVNEAEETYGGNGSVAETRKAGEGGANNQGIEDDDVINIDDEDGDFVNLFKRALRNATVLGHVEIVSLLLEESALTRAPKKK
jgi:hypothetical protein